MRRQIPRMVAFLNRYDMELIAAILLLVFCAAL